MSDRTFSQLAPFIQEYIYHHHWTELRPAQIAACQVIFETDAHLLIAAATAAGKTEAAFLPVLTILHNNPANSIGALYIGPIKALINDQFARLNDLLKLADIPVYHWHGDVSQNRKNQLLKNPQGILQITPESLESLLINKSQQLHRLFADLKFIIIDEIHAFMGSERGCQIICQLQRLAKFTKYPPRRIGLSATLGDYAMAEAWLGAGTDKAVITPQIESGKRQIKLALENFYLDKENPEPTEYEQYIFNLSQSRKCLIFANNRTQTESIIASLRQIATNQGYADIYHVHHGSISASLRQAAETAMREPNQPAVTAATLTLELGIDIGHLERVIQLESPLSVASFLQRLGRSGRRGETADMRFICGEEKPPTEAAVAEQIPWQLIQCIAIIQLYLEEKWIEPIKLIKYPLSLLYQQTMSIISAKGEISPAVLAQEIFNLAPFTAISKSDYLLLLRYLIDINHLQKTEQGKLILGLAGEKVVKKFQFYAIFADNQEYTVKQGTNAIGSIVTPPIVGHQFALAGRSWEVLDVDFKKKVIAVKPVEGKASIFWRGGSGNIHTRVLQKMRQVLLENTDYLYLQSNARQRLQEVRKLFKNSGLDNKNIIKLGKNRCCIFPWMGTVAYRTLEKLINAYGRESLEISSIGGVSPYYLTLKLNPHKIDSIYPEILSLCQQRISPEDLVSHSEPIEINKYDEFIPHPLLQKAFAHDYLDMEELRQQVASWVVDNLEN
ncbi:DEAD/DEAH box helicase domain protein [Richelia sinica FACHB-800]|uniref:DEAD/DEAH box helicase domain protein n=1 Tax=Richelia sinica FACHB-800 TaxID=1357546 RepID=A0A975T5X9_9NOST|nr:DEAD/DEAH box helicase [Richelia sinica]MBD2663704.1 DEAD/DEAH box helicase [Richelia sinica FACHB-800]QXE22729.1 DEAD/DEAH box helicase domain protein [Richelia sinica FACHB-800]